MIPSERNDATAAIHWRADETAMDTFTVRLPKWPILLRLRGRDPLVRSTDLVEALVVVLVVVVSLFAVPITAAVGTAVYDSSRHVYAEQAHARHTVTAVVSDVPVSQQIVRTGTTTVSARWTAAGTEHTDTVKAQSTTKPGDTVAIWIDDNGAQVPGPTPTARAAAEAAIGAVVIWISVAGIGAAIVSITRAACDRIRFAGWQHDLDSLVGNGDGHQHPGRTP